MKRTLAVALAIASLSAMVLLAAPGSAGATDYNYCGSNHFNFFNSIKKAHGYGDLNVYNSFSCHFPGGVTRAQFASGTQVTDYGSHVKCIWARVRVSYLTGGASLPLGVSVSGSSATDGWYGHCRGSDTSTSPAPFNLSSVGYATRTLLHMYLDIGSSSGTNDPIVYSTQTVY